MAAAPDVLVMGEPFLLVVEPVATPALIVAAGTQGPPGRNGAGVGFVPVPFAFGDASPRAVHVVGAAQLVSSAQIVIGVPFDGAGASLRLSTSAGFVLLDSDQVAPDFPATYESTPGAALPDGTAIYLEITPGAGATAGSGFVVLNLN